MQKLNMKQNQPVPPLILGEVFIYYIFVVYLLCVFVCSLLFRLFMKTINMGEIEKIHQGIPELPGMVKWYMLYVASDVMLVRLVRVSCLSQWSCWWS